MAQRRLAAPVYSPANVLLRQFAAASGKMKPV
jgi:hypothetical protein